VLFTSIDNFVANDTTTTSETHESFQNGFWWKKYVFWSTIFATNPRAARWQHQKPNFSKQSIFVSPIFAASSLVP
jgi:DNA modification methylase